MKTVRMEVYSGSRPKSRLQDESAMLVDIEMVAPGVGKMACPECAGDPESYAASFGPGLAPHGCVDCKNQGWVYVSV